MKPPRGPEFPVGIQGQPEFGSCPHRVSRLKIETRGGNRLRAVCAFLDGRQSTAFVVTRLTVSLQISLALIMVQVHLPVSKSHGDTDRRRRRQLATARQILSGLPH